MRRILVLIVLFCMIASAADAQKRKRRSTFGRKKPPYRYELVGSLGAANFLGDLGGANQIGTNGLKDLEFSLTRPALGAGIRFKIASHFSAKGNLFWGIVRGDDKLTQEPFRHARNMNFKSNIFELSGQVEFKFSRDQKGHVYQIKGVRGMKRKERDMYLFAGGGLLAFNPKGKYTDGSWHKLQPLGTEGQGILPDMKKYSRVTGMLSVGGGFRLALNRYWGVGFELGMRKTFSDYIDDVSGFYPDQTIYNGDPISSYFSNPSPTIEPAPGLDIRGDHTDKDAYMFACLTVGYKVMFKKRSRSKF